VTRYTGRKSASLPKHARWSAQPRSPSGRNPVRTHEHLLPPKTVPVRDTDQRAPVYWLAVTDVPCPVCETGTVRWAEARYIPDYRICDGREAHFFARGTAVRPILGVRSMEGLGFTAPNLKRLTVLPLAAVAGDCLRAARDHVLEQRQHRGSLLARACFIQTIGPAVIREVPCQLVSIPPMLAPASGKCEPSKRRHEVSDTLSRGDESPRVS